MCMSAKEPAPVAGNASFLAETIRLGHPENYLFILSKQIYFLDPSIQK